MSRLYEIPEVIFIKIPCLFQVSDYLEVIKEPMDLSTVITKIDKHNYLTAKDFLKDIDLICSNALEYNPDKDPGGKNALGKGDFGDQREDSLKYK